MSVSLRGLFLRYQSVKHACETSSTDNDFERLQRTRLERRRDMRICRHVMQIYNNASNNTARSFFPNLSWMLASLAAITTHHVDLNFSCIAKQISNVPAARR